MLSFQQKPNTTFSASSDKTVPSDVHCNAARSCSIDAPDTQPHTLASVVRRERYLTDLTAKYVCRWKIITDEECNGCNANGDLKTEETVSPIAPNVLSRAFHATIPIPFEKREHMCEDTLTKQQLCKKFNAESNVDAHDANKPQETANADKNNNKENKQKEETKESESSNIKDIVNIVVDVDTKCWQGTMLHDWSQDALKTDELYMKTRQHVLCKYTHPCNDGKVCVPLEEKKSVEVADARFSSGCTSNSSKKCVTGTIGGYAYMTELHALLEKRSKQTTNADGSSEKPSKIVKKVERQLAQRKREQRRARELEQEEAAVVRKETDAVCARMIERTRARSSGRDCPLKYVRTVSKRPKSLIVEDNDDDYDDTTSTDSQYSDDSDESSSTELRGQAISVSDSSSDSATFSDEKTYDYIEQEDSTTSDDGTSSDDEDTSSDDDETDLYESSDATSEDEQEEKEKEGECVNKMVRQSNVEVMIPICEPEDTFEFFQKLDCPYIMQWANKERTRLHIYRRHHLVSNSYFFRASVETFFQLIVTISVV